MTPHSQNQIEAISHLKCAISLASTPVTILLVVHLRLSMKIMSLDLVEIQKRSPLRDETNDIPL